MARGDEFSVVYVDGDVPQRPIQLGQLLVDSSQVSPGVTALLQCTSQTDPAVYEPLMGGYPRTQAEIAAGLTPADYTVPPVEAGSVVYLSRHLGWDPTGVASSRQAFLNALELVLEQGANHTDAAQIGGVIVVPYGVALLDDTVTLGYDGIQIVGGHGATIKTDDAFYAFTAESADLQKVYGVKFRNLRFISTITGRDADSGAIHFVAAEKFSVRDCTFHLRTEHGIRCTDSIVGRVQDSLFDSGLWQQQGMKYGVFSDVTNDAAVSTGASAFSVTRCSFGRTTEAGIALLGQPISDAPTLLRKETSGISLTENHFEHNYGDAIQLVRNRGVRIVGNWFEDGGLDATSGRGYVMDKATDDVETGGGATSGQNAALTIQGNVFGGHSSAHADFQHVGLKFAVNAGIVRNYFTDGIIGITADCAGLRMEDNWSSEDAPTLAGALPTICYLRNNRRGPNASISVQRAWGGSFADREADGPPIAAADADTTPSTISSTGERIRTMLLSNTGATNVTNFDDAYDGQILRVIATNGNTTLINGTDNGLNLAANANVTLGTSDLVEFVFVAGSGGLTNRWIEKGRVDS